MIELKKLIVLFVMILAFSEAQAYKPSANTSNKIIGVRLDDVARHLPNEVPHLKEQIDTIKSRIGSLLNVSKPIVVTHNIFFNRYPRSIGGFGSDIELDITAFLEFPNNDFAFVKGRIIVNKRGVTGRQYTTIPLKDTYLSIEVGLIERKAVLTDENNDLKMVFPLGVGAFDEGVQNLGSISLVTPRFQDAWIDKREAYASRTKPAYFAGKPFIRITTQKEYGKGYTPIGFHAQPNLAPFFRGYDSHGCMRMQTPDLEALHRIVAYGRHTHLPVKVLYRIDDNTDHPFPKVNSPFQTILNVGTANDPYYKLDSDGLVQIVRVKRTPPVHQLFDDYADDFYSIFDYDSRERLVPEGYSRPSTTTNSGSTTTRPSPSVQPVRTFNVQEYCQRKFPYHTAGAFTRNRMIRNYNQCVKDVVDTYNRSGYLPRD